MRGWSQPEETERSFSLNQADLARHHVGYAITIGDGVGEVSVRASLTTMSTRWQMGACCPGK
jgi:hypothetical protein